MKVDIEDCNKNERAVGLSCESGLLVTESGVIISQFLLFMQHQNLWPCRVCIGEDTQKLTGDEAIELKDKFKKLLADGGVGLRG